MSDQCVRKSATPETCGIIGCEYCHRTHDLPEYAKEMNKKFNKMSDVLEECYICRDNYKLEKG